MKNHNDSEIPGFVRWWSLWPPNTQTYARKVNRVGCRAIWISRGFESIAEEICAGIEAWKASAAWAKDDGQWIPLPATWLAQERWGDPPPPRPSAQSAAATEADMTKLRQAFDRLYPTVYAADQCYERFVAAGLGTPAFLGRIQAYTTLPAFLRWATRPKMSGKGEVA